MLDAVIVRALGNLNEEGTQHDKNNQHDNFFHSNNTPI